MEKEVKFTPGPWKPMRVTTPQYGSPEHGWGVVADEPMRGRIDSAIAGMREPDAHLIAAAPDLLQACKDVQEWLAFRTPLDNNLKIWNENFVKANNAIVAAISKAEPR